MTLSKNAIGNLINRYRAVLKKCHLINTFGGLAMATMLVMGGAGVANAEMNYSVDSGALNVTGTSGGNYLPDHPDVTGNITSIEMVVGDDNKAIGLEIKGDVIAYGDVSGAGEGDGTVTLTGKKLADDSIVRSTLTINAGADLQAVTTVNAYGNLLVKGLHTGKVTVVENGQLSIDGGSIADTLEIAATAGEIAFTNASVKDLKTAKAISLGVNDSLTYESLDSGTEDITLDGGALTAKAASAKLGGTTDKTDIVLGAGGTLTVAKTIDADTGDITEYGALDIDAFNGNTLAPAPLDDQDSASFKIVASSLTGSLGSGVTLGDATGKTDAELHVGADDFINDNLTLGNSTLTLIDERPADVVAAGAVKANQDIVFAGASAGLANLVVKNGNIELKDLNAGSSDATADVFGSVVVGGEDSPAKLTVSEITVAESVDAAKAATLDVKLNGGEDSALTVKTAVTVGAADGEENLGSAALNIDVNGGSFVVDATGQTKVNEKGSLTITDTAGTGSVALADLTNKGTVSVSGVASATAGNVTNNKTMSIEAPNVALGAVKNSSGASLTIGKDVASSVTWLLSKMKAHPQQMMIRPFWAKLPSVPPMVQNCTLVTPKLKPQLR